MDSDFAWIIILLDIAQAVVAEIQSQQRTFLDVASLSKIVLVLHHIHFPL